MNCRIVAATLALGAFLPALPAFAQSSAVFKPQADLLWNAVPDAPGVMIAALQGDPAKGASHFLLKFPSGFSAPVHHHTANHYVTVVAGTLVLIVDGKEQRLPAGSFASFSNKKKHATRCEAGADCILSMDVRGRWDVLPEGQAKGGSKAARK